MTRIMLDMMTIMVVAMKDSRNGYHRSFHGSYDHDD